MLILGGPLYSYNEQNMCFNLGMTVEGTKEECINPEGFASFLGLLESIPLHDTSSGYGWFEYVMPDLRYIFFNLFFFLYKLQLYEAYICFCEILVSFHMIFILVTNKEKKKKFQTD